MFSTTEYFVILGNDVIYQTNDFQQAVIYADHVWLDADQPIFVLDSNDAKRYFPGFFVEKVA